EGEPMVTFDDVRTPDLVFDDVVLVDDASVDEPASGGPIWRVSDVALPPGQAWAAIRSESFPEIPAPPALPAIGTDDERIEELRRRHYNATITHRSEEHTSELQSRENLVCRLLLEKKKKKKKKNKNKHKKI